MERDWKGMSRMSSRFQFYNQMEKPIFLGEEDQAWRGGGILSFGHDEPEARVVGWIMAPKDIQVPNPGTCDCYIAKVLCSCEWTRAFEMERLFSISQGSPNGITDVLVGGGRGICDCREEGQCDDQKERLESGLPFADRERGHKPGSTDGH